MEENLREVIENMITDDCYNEDLINVSQKRYGRIFSERNKYKNGYFHSIIISIIIICILISALIIFSWLNNETINNLKANIEQLNLSNKDLTYELKEYSAIIEEKDKEYQHLKEENNFLLLQLLSNKNNSSKEELNEIENTKSIVDWRKNVNLFTVGQECPLPQGIDTNTFRCMDYRTITDTTSYQYKLQLQSKTNMNSGLRFYEYKGEKYYMVALATAYGIDLGNLYRIELANGTTFNIIHAEYKHDIRFPSPTDYGDSDINYDDEPTISVIEFIYDWVNAPRGLIGDGEANRWLGENCDIYGDGCNIVKMTYIGEIEEGS